MWGELTYPLLFGATTIIVDAATQEAITTAVLEGH
jgi:hypothetical protein